MSKPPHPKYKLKEADTIESITNHFGVDPEKWLGYHNRMCRLEHVIRKSLPKELSEIYLLPELWDKVQELNRIPHKQNPISNLPSKVIFGYKNTLPLKKKWISKNYGINISIENNEKLNTIKYEVKLEWFEINDDYFVKINKISPLYINNKLPDLMIERLATDAFDIIYPITFSLDNHGQIIDIHNFKELNERWEASKQTLQQNKKGEILEKYIQLTENTIKNKVSLLAKLKSNWFFYTFFLGIYQTYTETLQIDKIISFPFTQGVKPYEYQTKQNISEYFDNYGKLQIKIEGNLIDQRTKKDFEYEQNEQIFTQEQPLAGSYYAKYFIDPNDHRIDTYITECTLDAKKIKIQVSSFQ